MKVDQCVCFCGQGMNLPPEGGEWERETAYVLNIIYLFLSGDKMIIQIFTCSFLL